MTPTIKVKGIKKVSLDLRHLGERVQENARKQMHRSAERIVKEAKINVPEDWGALKEAIHIEKSYGTRNRLQIDIVVGGDQLYESRHGWVDVQQYAWIIHEHYEQYEPGKRTKKKMAEYPGRVGSKFLTRAAEDENKKLANKMVGVINEVVKEVME